MFVSFILYINLSSIAIIFRRASVSWPIQQKETISSFIFVFYREPLATSNKQKSLYVKGND